MNTFCADSSTTECPAVQPGDGGSTPTSALHSFIRSPEESSGKDFSAPYTEGPEIVPTTLRKANDFVAVFHRHTGRTARNGGKFAIGLAQRGSLIGVAILGNPLSATLMDGLTAEVLRVCVLANAPKGACSQLYMACWRAWRAMGGTRLVTYTLSDESGASLKGAGWSVVGQTKPCKEGWRKSDDGCERTHTAVMALVKNRWQITRK